MPSSDLPTSDFLIFQGQLQIQRMISCPASTAWHCCQDPSNSQDSTEFQAHALPLQNLPSPSKRCMAGQGLAQDAPRQLNFLPFSLSL